MLGYRGVTLAAVDRLIPSPLKLIESSCTGEIAKTLPLLMASTRAGKPLLRDFGGTNQRSLTKEIHPGYILGFLLWATKTSKKKSSNNHGPMENDPLCLHQNNRLSGIRFPLEKMVKNHPNHTGLITSPFISSSPTHYKSSDPRMKEAWKSWAESSGRTWKQVDCGGGASSTKILISTVMKNPRSNVTYKQGEHNCHNFLNTILMRGSKHFFLSRDLDEYHMVFSWASTFSLGCSNFSWSKSSDWATQKGPKIRDDILFHPTNFLGEWHGKCVQRCTPLKSFYVGLFVGGCSLKSLNPKIDLPNTKSIHWFWGSQVTPYFWAG